MRILTEIENVQVHLFARFLENQHKQVSIGCAAGGNISHRSFMLKFGAQHHGPSLPDLE